MGQYQYQELREEIETMVYSKEHMNNICLQMLFLANTLLNSKPYTV